MLKNPTQLTPEIVNPFKDISLLDMTVAKSAFDNKGSRHDQSPLEINENGLCQLSFNVMDGRQVNENLHIKKYKVWPGYIEAQFDREYFSSMEKSPNHLIFLTGLIHSQRILYVYLCSYFGITYFGQDSEKFKIWPTGVSVDLTAMVTDTKNVTHKMLVEKIVRVGPRKYLVSARSKFNDHIETSGDCLIYDIR